MRKVNDGVDAPPFITGVLTLLRQFHPDELSSYVRMIGQYIRSHTGAALSRSVSGVDSFVL